MLSLSAAPVRAAVTPDALMAQLESADPSLETYRANVEFSVGLYSFPFLHKTVHGEAFFRRPGKMEIVFSDLPGIAQRFRQLYVGLGTPVDWAKKFEIGAAETILDGNRTGYLILTPKKAESRLKEVDVFVDPKSSLPARIVWRYSDGAIAMQQTIADVDGHSVIAAQQADIRLPGVHAYVNTKITDVRVNAIFEDSVFTKKPQP